MSYTRSLDDAWNDAVAYLESLPNYREPQIGLRFDRTEDRRRHIMTRNNTPLINFDVWVSIKRLDGEKITDTSDHPFFYQHSECIKASPAEAVDSAILALKEYMAANA